MYVRTAQGVNRRPTRGFTLGASWWDNLSFTPGGYGSGGSAAPPGGAGGTTAPPPVTTPSGFIPGSSITDYLMNAVTGKPTDAQIAVNTNTCVASIQRMRQMQGGSAIPPGAEAGCATDQEAYKKLIGGTADQLLANVIPSASAISWTAIGILAAVVLVVYAVKK